MKALHLFPLVAGSMVVLVGCGGASPQPAQTPATSPDSTSTNTTNLDVDALLSGLEPAPSATSESGSPPQPPPRETSGTGACSSTAVAVWGSCLELKGTRWQHVDGDDSYTIEFLPGGRFRTHNPADTTPDNDTWAVHGNEVHWWYNNGYAEYTGTLSDATTMSGTARNIKGKQWSWRATRGSRARGKRADCAKDAVEPETIAASHILIMFVGARRAPASVTRTEEEARRLAQELLARIRQGEDFAELARQHTDDPGSRSRGGHLGSITRARMIKPFADAAFGLCVGEVSEVTQTVFGFHIILRTE